MTKTSNDLINDYKKIEDIVATNPDITAEGFRKELEKGKIDINIINQNNWTLFHYAVFSKNHNTKHKIDDHGVSLKIIELFTSLKIKIHAKDSACMTVLDIVAINKQIKIMEMLLNSNEFSEQEKINALCFASMKGNVEEVALLISYINDINIQGTKDKKTPLQFAQEQNNQEIITLLENAINKKKEEQGTPDLEKNRAGSSSNENTGSTPVATVTPISITNTNLLTTTPSHDGSEPATLKPSKQDGKEYKKSKEDFNGSLKKDVVGIVVTGLLITAAIFAPLFGAIVFGILAACAATGTLIHFVNSTLPCREMQENKVEHTASHVNLI